MLFTPSLEVKVFRTERHPHKLIIQRPKLCSLATKALNLKSEKIRRGELSISGYINFSRDKANIVYARGPTMREITPGMRGATNAE